MTGVFRAALLRETPEVRTADVARNPNANPNPNRNPNPNPNPHPNPNPTPNPDQVAVSVVDNLLLVHSLESHVVLLFDI